MTIRLTHSTRIVGALVAAAACTVALSGTVALAAQIGDETGVVTGTFGYSVTPPGLGATCGPAAWSLDAGGVSAAADADATDAFAFAGSTTVSGSGSSPCATAADDLFGSLTLTITATGSPGLVSCTGSGAYSRAATVLFSELVMACNLNGSPLPPAVVAFTAALVPTSTALTQFTVAGAYSFGLSDINP